MERLRRAPRRATLAAVSEQAGAAVGFDARSFSVDGTEHVTITGELDLATSPVLERLISATDRLHVVVDASRLGFIDVTGLSALLRCHQHLASRGGGLVVRGAPELLLRLREVLDLEEALPIEGS